MDIQKKTLSNNQYYLFFKFQKPRTTRSSNRLLRVHSSDFCNLDILQLKNFFFFFYLSFYFFSLFHLALSPTFTVSAGELAEASPYNCYLECLKQNIIQKDKPLTIGLAQGTICLCGHDPSKYFLFLCQHISIRYHLRIVRQLPHQMVA